MTRSLPALLVLAAIGQGCAPGCSSSSSFTGRTYQIFANPVSYNIENGAINDAPDFFGYEIPGNGTHQWSFRWGNTDVGPVDITINGVTFAGQGDWDTTECGHLILDFEGTIEGDETGARHVFNAAANLTVWQDKLGGLLIWNETFTLPDGETGTWRSTSHLDGTLTSGGGT